MLRIGVIGAGGRGLISRYAHRPSEGSEIIAVCDPRESVGEQYRRDVSPSIASYVDWKQLLSTEMIDAAFITTPDYLHEEMAVRALDAGIAVYLEKPLAISIEGCDRILAAAARSGAKLYVGHNMRFFATVQKMKQLIDDGRIGQIQAIWCRHFVSYGGDAYFKDWHSERQYTNGLLLQKGAHDIDVIHYLAGAYTVRTVGMGKLSVYHKVSERRDATARGDAAVTSAWPPGAQKGLSPTIDVEDHSMVLMQLANGVQASYEQCHYAPDAHRNYTVIGTKGRIENYGDFPMRDEPAVVRVWDQRLDRHRPDGDETFIIREATEAGHGGADERIVADFLHYVRTGIYRGATPVCARMAVAVGCLATESLRSGNQPYDIPPPPRFDTGAVLASPQMVVAGKH